MPNEDNPSRMIEFSEYEILTEPSRAEKARLWRTAVGLQVADGLPTSDCLLGIARKHIDGRIDIHEAGRLIDAYYNAGGLRTEKDMLSREGDIISCRITAALSEKAFTLSPVSIIALHRRLFGGVFRNAGRIRTCNISKQEWCLNGDSVKYASCEEIPALLEHVFEQEQRALSNGIALDCAVAHFTKFASNLWQIHPFSEGNTRTTAVYLIKYLDSLGLRQTHLPFADNARYFRNALVRANYSNMQLSISRTPKFLERFTSNMILKTELPLKNRCLHVDWLPDED